MQHLRGKSRQSRRGPGRAELSTFRLESLVSWQKAHLAFRSFVWSPLVSFLPQKEGSRCSQVIAAIEVALAHVRQKQNLPGVAHTVGF